MLYPLDKSIKIIILRNYGVPKKHRGRRKMGSKKEELEKNKKK